MFNRVVKYGVANLVEESLALCNDLVDTQEMVIKLKFALYIVFLFIIFVILWQKMVTNMKMDIVKTLGILNILPTTHLASSPELLKTLNTSSLIS